MCILCRENINYSLVETKQISHPSIEIQAIQVPVIVGSDRETLVIVNVYRHPGQNTPTDVLNEIFSLREGFDNAMFFGDFNAHYVMWNDHRNDTVGSRLANAIEDHDLIILNDDSPTYVNLARSSHSIIDLTIATFSIALSSELSVESDLRGSDHFPISITIECRPQTTNRFNYKFKLNKKQWKSLFVYLEKFEDPVEEDRQDSVSEYETFIQTIYNFVAMATDQSVQSLTATRTKASTRKSSPALWWNEACDEAIGNRKTALSLYKLSPNAVKLESYRETVNKCRRILRKEKRKEWKELCGMFNAKTRSAEVWGVIRSFEKRENVSFNPTDSDKYNSLCDKVIENLCPSFCPVLRKLDMETARFQDCSRENIQLRMDQSLQLNKIQAAIRSSKPDSAPGLDMIGYDIIHLLPVFAVEQLLIIFNNFLREGCFPETWLQTLVIFISKAGGGVAVFAQSL